MATFVCERCQYSTTKKTNLKVHLEKINICPPTNNDIPRDDLLAKLYPNKISKKTYDCSCGKIYSHASGLCRHKKMCVYKPPQEKDNAYLLKIVDELKEEIEKLKFSPNIVNNNTTINNTIILNDFGKENMEYISETFVRKCLKQQDHGFVKLTEKIHFNDDHPENKNVSLPNKKEPYVQVVEKGKPTLKPKKEVIDDLIVNIGNILDEQLEYVTDELKKNWVKNEQMARELDKFMKQVFEDDSNIRKKLTERVYLLLVNNR